MVLWFAVAATVLVAEVFRSPVVDYRTVAIGALLPLVEAVTGVSLLMHTLAGPVVVLGAVMAATVNRRLLRRRLLGVPIGMFLHQVLDGTWTSKELFWWPAFGRTTAQPLPEEGRSFAFVIALEVVGLVIGVWAWRRYQLDDAENRRLLARSGHLARSVLP